MDIISRLKLFLESQNIPVSRFADDCRIPRPTLSQLLNGRNKKVSDEVISKIHEAYPALSVMWLMFGEGSMLSGVATSTPSHTANTNTVVSGHLPGVRTAGSTVEAQQPSGADTQVSQPNANIGSPRISFDMGYDDQPNAEADTTAPATPHRQPQFEDYDTNPITLSTKAGKRVVSIVVYYDDKSYESFVPDKNARSPF